MCSSRRTRKQQLPTSARPRRWLSWSLDMGSSIAKTERENINKPAADAAVPKANTHHSVVQTATWRDSKAQQKLDKSRKVTDAAADALADAQATWVHAHSECMLAQTASNETQEALEGVRQVEGAGLEPEAPNHISEEKQEAVKLGGAGGAGLAGAGGGAPAASSTGSAVDGSGTLGSTVGAGSAAAGGVGKQDRLQERLAEGASLQGGHHGASSVRVAARGGVRGDDSKTPWTCTCGRHRGKLGITDQMQGMQSLSPFCLCHSNDIRHGMPRNEQVEQAAGQVAVLSKTADGCRRVQGALKSALKPDQKAIVHELKGHVCELLESPHGNHVLQLAVELLPPDAVDFVCSEILQRWSAADLARQPYGCRVLERLIEHFPRGRLECALRDILGNVETLSGDQYGNFVIQHLLEHGDDAQRRHIAGVVRQNPALFVHGVSACGVLDKILTYGSWNDQVDIAERIVAQEPLLATMAASAHGFASTQRLFTIAAHARACPAAAGGGLLEAACRQLLEPPALDRMMAS
ncbi:unnamed protein product, partial [Prorocentrum cordatum]